ncbi:MerR family transcriptional regulator [Deinococcus hopiensis]|uniref:MerR family transcriptional regulator n=1 Tax=Deinococcus hopiensis TaxID=309885 RepID=UPI001FECB3EF|nr:MerR family transcriptional regulator [Deinococcus hopiensis]
METVRRDTPKDTEETQVTWTVGDVSALTRVSVRTLHHYDDLGLLRPGARSEANYRLYTAADLARLWRILTYRDLGFGLSEIGRLLQAPPEQERAALQTQAALLREQQRRTQATLDAVEAFLQAAGRGEGEVSIMTNRDIKEIFDGFDHRGYEAEAEERWGDTDAYKQSAQRVKRYAKQDWETIKGEMRAITDRYLALMAAGVAPESPKAQAVAAAHREHFHRRYYDCSPEMFRSLAQMWVEDERFTHNIDKAGPGLAAYQSAAAVAWADAQGKAD